MRQLRPGMPCSLGHVLYLGNAANGTCRRFSVYESLTTYPCSKNCISSRRCCQYELAKIPLRERRAHERQLLIPGQQRPWVSQPDQVQHWFEHHNPSSAMAIVSSGYIGHLQPSPRQGGLSGEIDPFDSMPVRMRYKSRDLLYYCEWRHIPPMLLWLKYKPCVIRGRLYITTYELHVQTRASFELMQVSQQSTR
jgi:hypothetical protein